MHGLYCSKQIIIIQIIIIQIKSIDPEARQEISAACNYWICLLWNRLHCHKLVFQVPSLRPGAHHSRPQIWPTCCLRQRIVPQCTSTRNESADGLHTKGRDTRLAEEAWYVDTSIFSNVIIRNLGKCSDFTVRNRENKSVDEN